MCNLQCGWQADIFSANHDNRHLKHPMVKAVSLPTFSMCPALYLAVILLLPHLESLEVLLSTFYR